jgi:hypothetical protein
VISEAWQNKRSQTALLPIEIQLTTTEKNTTLNSLDLRGEIEKKKKPVVHKPEKRHNH